MSGDAEVGFVGLYLGVTHSFAARRPSQEGSRSRAKGVPGGRGVWLAVRVFYRAALLAAFTVIFPSFLRAETTVAFPTTPSSGVTVRLATPLTQLPHFGFLPVRVFVENLTSSDGTWELNFQVGSRGISSTTLSTSFSVGAAAGQTRETWIYVPIAQAGFAINTGSGGAGGAAARLAAGRVTIAKTPTGVTVTRGTGSNVMIVTEINEMTGERTEQVTGRVTTPPTTLPPPPGKDVVFSVNPSTGIISTTMTNMSGATPKFTILTAGAGGVPAVTIAPTGTGTIVRVVNAATGITEETDFNTRTGEVTTSRTLPGGAVTKNTLRTPPVGPGGEIIFVIDPMTGNYNVQRTRAAGQGSGGPTKYSVTMAGGGRAGAVWTPSIGSGATAPVGTAAPMPITVEIVGPGYLGGARVVMPNGSNANTMRPFAVATTLESIFRAAIAPEVRGAPNISGVAITQLPADWRLWSGFAGLILSSDEFVGLDAAHRGAIRGWAGMGGQIYLVPSEAGELRSEKIGAGGIVTLPAPLPQISAADLRTMLRIYEETPALPDRETLLLKNTPLGDEMEKPARDTSWVAVFLIVFAVTIGPVNLFAFAPRAKRHRLFWTTPALAVAGGIVLVVAIFLQDGLGGEGRRSTLAVLLPGQNQAAVFQEQMARTGFLMKRTFPLEDDVVLAPLGLGGANPPRIFDTAMAQRADGQGGGDWFQSRSRPAHLVRRLVPTRGRVERVGVAAGGAPVIESSLATVLREFVLRDSDGKSWRAEKIQPGERVTLSAATETGISSSPLGGSRGLTLVYEAATAARAGGTWTASGDETDIAPVATLGSLRWAKSDVAYVGVAESRVAAVGNGGGR